MEETERTVVVNNRSGNCLEHLMQRLRTRASIVSLALRPHRQIRLDFLNLPTNM